MPHIIIATATDPYGAPGVVIDAEGNAYPVTIGIKAHVFDVKDAAQRIVDKFDDAKDKDHPGDWYSFHIVDLPVIEPGEGDPMFERMSG